LVHKPLAPLSTWVQIHDTFITTCNSYWETFMPAKLTTTINKIKAVPNPVNAEIIDQFTIIRKKLVHLKTTKIIV
jgi:hypothetical protein